MPEEDLRNKINTSRAAKLEPSKAAVSRFSPPINTVKEADRSTGQSSKGAKVQAATIDPRGEAVPCAPGEADLMDTHLLWILTSYGPSFSNSK